MQNLSFYANGLKQAKDCGDVYFHKHNMLYHTTQRYLLVTRTYHSDVRDHKTPLELLIRLGVDAHTTQSSCSYDSE